MEELCSRSLVHCWTAVCLKIATTLHRPWQWYPWSQLMMSYLPSSLCTMRFYLTAALKSQLMYSQVLLFPVLLEVLSHCGVEALADVVRVFLFPVFFEVLSHCSIEASAHVVRVFHFLVLFEVLSHCGVEVAADVVMFFLFPVLFEVLSHCSVEVAANVVMFFLFPVLFEVLSHCSVEAVADVQPAFPLLCTPRDSYLTAVLEFQPIYFFS